MSKTPVRKICDALELTYNAAIFYLLIYVLDIGHLSLTGRNIFTLNLLLLSFQLGLYAGCWGGIVDICSGRNSSFSFRLLLINLSRFYWVPLIGALITVFLYILINTILAIPNIHSLFAFRYFLFPIFLPMYLIVLLKIKKIPIDYQNQGSLFLFTVFSCTILYWLTFLFSNNLDSTAEFSLNASLLLSRCLEFFIAVYWASNLIKENPSHQPPRTELILVAPRLGGILVSLLATQEKMHPAIFTLLKALSPSDYTVRIFNVVPIAPWNYASGKLVAIMGYTQNIHMSYAIAKNFRAKGSTVVMGGAHVTAIPHEALMYCDSVVVGPAETVWPQLIKDYESGALKKIYYGDLTEEAMNASNEKILSLPDAETADFLEITRGCKFKCEFCVGHCLYQNKLFKRTPENVRSFIQKAIEQFRLVALLDSNIYADPEYTKRVLRHIADLKFHWVASSSIDIAADDEMLSMIKRSGCKFLAIGYEIFEDSEENKKGGKFALVSNYKAYTKKIKKKGIYIRANLMFGFDHDKWLDIFKLWKFAISIFPMATALSIVVPFPGSALFERLQKEGRIADLTWRNYHVQHLVFDHPYLHGPLTNHILPFFHFFIFLTTSYFGMLVLYLIYYVGFYYVSLR